MSADKNTKIVLVGYDGAQHANGELASEILQGNEQFPGATTLTRGGRIYAFARVDDTECGELWVFVEVSALPYNVTEF